MVKNEFFPWLHPSLGKKTWDVTKTSRSSTDLLEPLGTLNGNKCFGGQRIRESYELVRFLGSTEKDGSFEGKQRV